MTSKTLREVQFVLTPRNITVHEGLVFLVEGFDNLEFSREPNGNSTLLEDPKKKLEVYIKGLDGGRIMLVLSAKRHSYGIEPSYVENLKESLRAVYGVVSERLIKDYSHSHSYGSTD